MVLRDLDAVESPAVSTAFEILGGRTWREPRPRSRRAVSCRRRSRIASPSSLLVSSASRALGPTCVLGMQCVEALERGRWTCALRAACELGRRFSGAGAAIPRPVPQRGGQGGAAEQAPSRVRRTLAGDGRGNHTSRPQGKLRAVPRRRPGRQRPGPSSTSPSFGRGIGCRRAPVEASDQDEAVRGRGIGGIVLRPEKDFVVGLAAGNHREAAFLLDDRDVEEVGAIMG